MLPAFDRISRRSASLFSPSMNKWPDAASGAASTASRVAVAGRSASAAAVLLPGQLKPKASSVWCMVLMADGCLIRNKITG
jgi:hypothetical protein